MIVVDASALLEVLLRTPLAEAVEARIFGERESLHAPHLIDLEVAQVLRRYYLTDELTSFRADQALGKLAEIRLARYPHDVLLPRVWNLRENLTAYDAAYVALAEALDAPLLTTDARFSRAPGHGASVILVS